MITSRKITAFTKKVADLPDKTAGAYTAAQAKAQFDAAPEELREAHNSLIDDLGSTAAGDSGAKGIGVSPIAGVTGTNVQAVVEDLKLQINGAVAGSIPPGSITEDKLAFEIATDAASVSITDTANHFTATNVEGALDELFTSASSVKTNVANAIGAPATSSDTGAQLASKITTEKGRIASEIGDGDSSSSLQYLADRLIVRSNDIATQVNAKGVAATSADTLATLATKVGQINVSNLKNIQRGVINPNTGTSRTVTISAVDITKSIVKVGYLASSGLSNKDMFAAQLTNSTTLTILNGGALAESHEVSWEVIEFENVKSKQSGTLVAGLTTATVTAVNPAKSLLFVSATNVQNFNAPNEYVFHGIITNSTTLTFKGSGNITCYWQLIEFN